MTKKQVKSPKTMTKKPSSLKEYLVFQKSALKLSTNTKRPKLLIPYKSRVGHMSHISYSAQTYKELVICVCPMYENPIYRYHVSQSFKQILQDYLKSLRIKFDVLSDFSVKILKTKLDKYYDLEK